MKHDIDLVTDRWLRRFGDPVDRGTGFVWPRDSWRWAFTRRDLAVRRSVHAFRNAALGMDHLSEAMAGAQRAAAAFADAYRRIKR